MSNIILTTGTYDLIKDHLRRKRVSIQEEEILETVDKKESKKIKKDAKIG